jgi:hypothetical protein
MAKQKSVNPIGPTLFYHGVYSLRLFSILLFLTILFTDLFAFKDAFIIGMTQGVTTGTSENNKISPLTEDYDTTGTFSAIKLGNDMNLDRAHQIKGRWEFTYEDRSYTYDLDGIETETTGRQLSIAFLWGYNIDVMLNYELVPFVKLGYGTSTTGEVGDAHHSIYGAGVYFVTKYLEIGAGIDREGKKFGGLRIDEETITDPHEESIATYMMLNIRLY